MSSIGGRAIKAVLFDVGGVLIPQPQIGITKYGKKLGLPPTFLGEIFTTGEPNNSFCKLERGELTISQFFPRFEEEFQVAARKNNVNEIQFSAKELFSVMTSGGKGIYNELLNAVDIIRNNGYLVGVISNNWMDDRNHEKQLQADFFLRLRLHFDVVIESSKVGCRKPEKRIYELALRELNVLPHEAIFLDDIGRNCKTASQMGMKSIKVTGVKQSLKELSKLVSLPLEVVLKSNDMIFPLPVTHDRVSHCYAEVQPGIVLHYIDVGTGPVVMLFHGFPELWYSWRYQISALVDAGYRVIAMDLRGYGESSSPYEINAYTQEKLCQDAIGLMNCLSLPLCTIIGHDWGGAVVWNLALNHPDRIHAVCSVNTPYFCHEGLQKLKDNIKVFNYQLYFQKPGVAEKELEQNMTKTFNAMYMHYTSSSATQEATKRGGIIVGVPDDIRTKLLSTEDVEYFVKNYTKTGFRGPLNYYRNGAVNKLFENSANGRKITCPALMVTTGNDKTLRPEFSEGMEKEIPRLSRAHIEDCGHWSMFEKPDELSKCLIDWLKNITQNFKSKL